MEKKSICCMKNIAVQNRRSIKWKEKMSKKTYRVYVAVPQKTAAYSLTCILKKNGNWLCAAVHKKP